MTDKDNQAPGVNTEGTTPSGAPTDTTVPGTKPGEPSGKTLTPEGQEPEGATTDTPGSETQPPSRAAQRIGELIRKNKELEEKLAGEPGVASPEDTPPTETAISPAESAETRAAAFLKKLGFVPKEEVSEQIKEQVEGLESRLILDAERQRLAKLHGGDDGLPTYDHDKVMQHARATGIYNPEAAYNDLYKKEIINKAVKDAQATPGTFVEKPSAPTSTDTQQFDRAALARILNSPEGRKWYENNREKVLAALQKGEL